MVEPKPLPMRVCVCSCAAVQSTEAKDDFIELRCQASPEGHRVIPLYNPSGQG